jgi:hypothetical protein
MHDGEEESAAWVECPNCGAEHEQGSYCSDCGHGQGETNAIEPTGVEREPVYAVEVEARPFPVHEPAYCPHCVAWLGTFPSKDEARAYERALTNHPLEYCRRRLAGFSGSTEFRLRFDAARFGSLAAKRPDAPRVSAQDE